MKLRPHTSPHGRVLAVSMMKDEAPYLLEWVAHNLALGFTDILVYTNDCTDGTDEMLIRLEELGLAHHRRNVIAPGIKPQPSAIKHAQNEPLVAASDWVILFDADEFLSIKHGGGTVDGLISAAGDANGIVITWRTFGSNGVVEWSRAPVTEQYTRAAPVTWNKGWGVKTLFKFDPEHWKLGIHRPKIKNKHLEDGFPDQVRWVNGSGQPMEEYFKFRGWRSIRRTLGYDWVQMNHYAVKSIDAYAVRKTRGNVNNKADKYNADYWALMDRNEEEDRSVLAHAPKRAEIMGELLTDPVLARLHDAALTRVEAQLEALHQTEAYAALKSSLLQASNTPIDDVAAKPPKARDPAKIAALMSEVERKAAARPKPERPPAYAGDPAQSSDVEWVVNQGVALPADPGLFTPLALEAIQTGKFQRNTARLVPPLLSGRVLILSAGIGFLPALACLKDPDLVVLAQEPRAPLAAAARRVARRAMLGPDQLTIVEDRDLAHMIVAFQPSVLASADPEIGLETLGAVYLTPVQRVIFLGPPQSGALPGFAEIEVDGPQVFDRA